MQEKIILANILDNSKSLAVVKLCRRLNINFKRIEQQDVNKSVASIINLKNKVFSEVLPQNDIKAPIFYVLPEIMIFSGLSDNELDEVLKEYKKDEIDPISLKAVVTPYNMYWSLYTLVEELKREKREIAGL